MITIQYNHISSMAVQYSKELLDKREGMKSLAAHDMLTMIANQTDNLKGRWSERGLKKGDIKRCLIVGVYWTYVAIRLALSLDTGEENGDFMTVSIGEKGGNKK